VSLDFLQIGQITERAAITTGGGFALRLTNKTGGASVKGTLVQADTTTDNAFSVEGANGIDPIGVVAESGVPDGSLCWVVIGGRVQVLLTDSTASTRGNWCAVSTTQAGRVDANAGSPPNQARHFQEVGHCLETKTAGTNVLAWINMHLN
jgi:hypothetical protein